MVEENELHLCDLRIPKGLFSKQKAGVFLAKDCSVIYPVQIVVRSEKGEILTSSGLSEAQGKEIAEFIKKANKSFQKQFENVDLSEEPPQPEKVDTPHEGDKMLMGEESKEQEKEAVA